MIHFFRYLKEHNLVLKMNHNNLSRNNEMSDYLRKCKRGTNIKFRLDPSRPWKQKGNWHFVYKRNGTPSLKYEKFVREGTAPLCSDIKHQGYFWDETASTPAFTQKWDPKYWKKQGRNYRFRQNRATRNLAVYEGRIKRGIWSNVIHYRWFRVKNRQTKAGPKTYRYDTKQLVGTQTSGVKLELKRKMLVGELDPQDILREFQVRIPRREYVGDIHSTLFGHTPTPTERRRLSKFTNFPKKIVPKWEEDSTCASAYVFKVDSTFHSNPNMRMEDIPMFNASFLIKDTDLSTWKDSGTMSCVPETLWHLFCENEGGKKDFRPLRTRFRGPVLTKEDIKRDLSLTKSMKDGFTSTEIKAFCERHNIRMIAVDYRRKEFLRTGYEGGEGQRNRKQRSLIYMLRNGHMYLMENENVLKSLANKNNQKVVETVIYQSGKKEEDGGWDPSKCKSINTTDLVEYYIAEYLNNGVMLPHNKVIWRKGQIVRIQDGDQRILADPFVPGTDGEGKEEEEEEEDDEEDLSNQELMMAPTRDERYGRLTESELVQSWIDKFNQGKGKKSKMHWTGQSPTSFGNALFYSLHPKHQKSCFTLAVARDFRATGGLVKKYLAVDDAEKDNLVAIDIRKCRTACSIENRLGPFKRFTVADTIESYDGGEITDGFYWVDWKNEVPWHVADMPYFSDGSILLLREKGFEFSITHQLRADPENTYHEDYLKSWAETFAKYPHFKKGINSAIGCFASTVSTKHRAVFESDLTTARMMYFQELKTIDRQIEEEEDIAEKEKLKHQKRIMSLDEGKETYIENIGLGDGWQQYRRLQDGDCDKHVYLMKSVQRTRKLENDLPIYQQILENERWRLFDLYEKVGGTLVEAKTATGRVCRRDWRVPTGGSAQHQ